MKVVKDNELLNGNVYYFVRVSIMEIAGYGAGRHYDRYEEQKVLSSQSIFKN